MIENTALHTISSFPEHVDFFSGSQIEFIRLLSLIFMCNLYLWAIYINDRKKENELNTQIKMRGKQHTKNVRKQVIKISILLDFSQLFS